MPRIDFAEISDVREFEPLPDGTYLCRLEEINTTTTKAGDEMWKLQFVVTEGTHEGRYVFDNLVFSPAAIRRVKLVCKSLGVEANGTMDLQPDLLLARTCRLTVIADEYTDYQGNRKTTNVVPFGGYEAAASSPF